MTTLASLSLPRPSPRSFRHRLGHWLLRDEKPQQIEVVVDSTVLARDIDEGLRRSLTRHIGNERRGRA